MAADFVVFRTVRRAGAGAIPQPLGYDFELWLPSLSRLLPPGAPRHTYAVWWLFDRVRIFRNADYAVVLARKGTELVHRLGVFPGYFRFPFMAADDLQIGDVWTSPSHRGRGLAAYGLQFAMEGCRGGRDRVFWYLSHDANVPSLRAATRAGFEHFGTAVRTRRLGVRSLGAYELAQEH